MVQSWILFILVIERGIGEELDLDQVLRFRLLQRLSPEMWPEIRPWLMTVF